MKGTIVGSEGKRRVLIRMFMPRVKIPPAFDPVFVFVSVDNVIYCTSPSFPDLKERKDLLISAGSAL